VGGVVVTGADVSGGPVEGDVVAALVEVATVVVVVVNGELETDVEDAPLPVATRTGWLGDEWIA
jgi:hypothetical protein